MNPQRVKNPAFVTSYRLSAREGSIAAYGRALLLSAMEGRSPPGPADVPLPPPVPAGRFSRDERAVRAWSLGWRQGWCCEALRVGAWRRHRSLEAT